MYFLPNHIQNKHLYFLNIYKTFLYHFYLIKGPYIYIYIYIITKLYIQRCNKISICFVLPFFNTYLGLLVLPIFTPIFSSLIISKLLNAENLHVWQKVLNTLLNVLLFIMSYCRLLYGSINISYASFIFLNFRSAFYLSVYQGAITSPTYGMLFFILLLLLSIPSIL
jgi:hypothetical protein